MLGAKQNQNIFSRRIDVALVESLSEAKNLREAADYYGDFSEINCKKLVKKAREFLNAAKKLLG